MALGIVDDATFDSEIDKYINGTRDIEQRQIPLSVKKLIADTGIESGNKAAIELANGLGLAERASAMYTRGETSRDFRENVKRTSPDLARHINKTKERIARKAGSLTRRAIDAITDEKLRDSSAAELSGIAQRAADVMTKMAPIEIPGEKNVTAVQIVLHAPPIRDEKAFDVIDITSSDE